MRACSCDSWRKEVGEIFSGCWGRNLDGIWQRLFTSSKLCLTARRKLSARDLEPDVWDVVCARSLLLEVKSWSLGTQVWSVEMCWSSRAGKCLGMSKSHWARAHWSQKWLQLQQTLGSCLMIPWQRDEWQQPAKIWWRTKISIHIVIASRNKSHWRGWGTVTFFFSLLEDVSLPKVRHLWDQCCGQDNFMWKLSRQYRMSSMSWDQLLDLCGF